LRHDQLIEAINQLNTVGFGEGAAVCQVCGSSLVEGGPVSAYAFRPASRLSFQVGYVLCSEHRDEYVTGWTLGVREIVVRGRVGVVRDVAMQSSWQVLLAPVPVVVSPADSRKAVRVEECDVGAAGEAAAETCSSDDDAESGDGKGLDVLRVPRTAGRSIAGPGSRVDGGAERDDVRDEWSGCGGDGGDGDA